MQMREHRHRPVTHFRMICKGSISVQPCGECIEENVLGRDTNPNALRIFGASHSAEEGGEICEPPPTGLPPIGSQILAIPPGLCAVTPRSASRVLQWVARGHGVRSVDFPVGRRAGYSRHGEIPIHSIMRRKSIGGGCPGRVGQRRDQENESIGNE